MSDKNLVEVWLQNDDCIKLRFTQSTELLQTALDNCGGRIISINDEGEAKVKVSPAGKDWLKANGHDFIDALPVAGEKSLAVFDAGDVETFHLFDSPIKVGLTA